MWAWLVGGYAVLSAGLIVYAGFVAVSGKDARRRADAFKVLKLVWGTVTGAGGIVAVALKLHEVGLF